MCHLPDFIAAIFFRWKLLSISACWSSALYQQGTTWFLNVLYGSFCIVCSLILVLAGFVPGRFPFHSHLHSRSRRPPSSSSSSKPINILKKLQPKTSKPSYTLKPFKKPYRHIFPISSNAYQILDHPLLSIILPYSVFGQQPSNAMVAGTAKPLSSFRSTYIRIYGYKLWWNRNNISWYICYPSTLHCLGGTGGRVIDK
jgi:hypothetical protein